MLKIYGVPISVHTRKVIVAAIEKKLQFEVDPVIPFNPPAGWDKLSPTGRIPAISDDGFDLADSAVICAYLEQTHPQPALYPTAAKDRARVLWLEEYSGSTVFREVVHGLFFQNVIRPKILQQGPADQAVIDSILETKLPKVFSYLEDQMSDGYLIANRFSIADVAVTSNLINYHYLGYRIDAARYPKLERYFKRLCAHPSIAAALRNEQATVDHLGLDRNATDALIKQAA